MPVMGCEIDGVKGHKWGDAGTCYTGPDARQMAEKQGAAVKADTVERLDFGRLSGVERTPQGGIRCPAHLTRTGIFIYTRADGSTVRELRHPDEVFSTDSIATLSGAPVTDLHPSTPVRPSTWKTTAVGHVGEDVRADGAFVSARLMIQDADAIAGIERGERKEISCGYSCRLDNTPGEFNGERYDAIQRSIRYNHVALGPENWGRAGNDVALRLDNKGNQITAGSPSEPKTEGEPMQKYTIDGVTYDTGSPEFIQAITQRDKRIDGEIAKLDAVTAERDALSKERDDAIKSLEEANAPGRLDALVAARVALVENARRLIGTEAKLDGKTDREIMIDAIKHNDDAFDADGKSDDYVVAYFDASTKSTRRHDEGGTGIGAARSAAVSATREDAKIEGSLDVDSARDRMLDHNNNAAGEPLRFSRNN